MLETVGMFVAKSIASYAVEKGLNSLFSNQQDFEKRLSVIINQTIEDFKTKNPIPETDGKFPFYDSQIMIDEFLKFRFFNNQGYQLDETNIANALDKNPNIIRPEKQQITSFLEIFEQNIQSDDELKKLEIDETYKSEIFNISTKIDSLFDKLVDELSKKLHSQKTIPKELTALVKIPKKDIIGRETDLAKLRNSLLHKSETALINGMGGIGKTTLAAVYVAEFYDDYDHIVWLTLKDSLEEAIAANYALIQNLQLKSIPTGEQLKGCLNVLRSLESNKPKLLVLDNANESLSAHYNELPKPPGWHLLVTSRERISEFDILDLDFLSEDEAIALFFKYHNNFSTEQVRGIVNEVERHTLTIEILAKSARKNRWSIKKVKNALATDASAGIKVKHNIQKIDRIKSYLVSIFDVSKLGDHEIYLLKQFTALPNLWIKYDFLSELLQTEALVWQDEFAGMLENLYEKGFLLKDTTADSFKMHPVLVEAFAPGFHATLEDLNLLTDSVSALLNLDQAVDNPIDKFQYIPFGDAILKQLSDKGSATVSGLKNNLAAAYEDLGEYEKARDLLEAALKSALENFGDKHPTVAVHQSNLANVYSDLGEYEKARDLWEAALKSDLENFGDKHPTVAVSQSNLANVYSDLGEYEKARDLWEAALKSDLENFGDKHPNVAVSQSNLATVYRNLGEYEKARDLLEAALKSDLENFGDKHPTVAVHQSNLANVYSDLGEYEKARDLWMKAYHIFFSALGEKHPHTNMVKEFLESLTKHEL